MELFHRMFPLDHHFNTLGSKYELMELVAIFHFISAHGHENEFLSQIPYTARKPVTVAQ